mmetsp:Transcript_16442/g.35782  ORF Transcript_16442/g.35782 Transcript_16442/m.35782 type:complete len:362 (+) Transcript_16442:161-1246(+)
MSVFTQRLIFLTRTPSHTCTKRVARSLSSTIPCRLHSSRGSEENGLTDILNNKKESFLRSNCGPIKSALASFSTSSSSPSNNNNDKEFAKLTRLEDANPKRISGIQVNPDSLGYGVLPGNLTYKTYKWSGNTRKIPLELAHGYFWMVSDLKKTNQKPTLSNETLIPEGEAQMFPILEGLTTLDDLDTNVDLPLFFLEQAHQEKKNKQRVGGKITLVAVTYRDNGFKMIPSWTEPFEEEFQMESGNKSLSRVQSFTVSITESWALYPIRNTVKRVMKRNNPKNKHSSTLAYFGTKEVMDFRDILRMHNIMTNFVFLLDDLGRVRFAGSGEASESEVTKLIRFAKELLRESDGARKKSSKKRQ